MLLNARGIIPLELTPEKGLARTKARAAKPLNEVLEPRSSLFSYRTNAARTRTIENVIGII